MLPYLGAIAASSAGPATRAVALTIYCVVMVLLAIVLLTARVALHDRVTGVLGQVEGG